MSDNQQEEISTVLVNQWQITLPENRSDSGPEAAILAALEERILHLLKHDKDKLMRALYILDVSEKRYREAVSRKKEDVTARLLARAVFDRETEKIILRRKYSGGKSLEQDC